MKWRKPVERIRRIAALEINSSEVMHAAPMKPCQ